jgi:hypothetical protein
MQQVARKSYWFETAASVFAFIVLSPFLSLAMLWFGMIGMPLLLTVFLPALALNAGNGD